MRILALDSGNPVLGAALLDSDASRNPLEWSAGIRYRELETGTRHAEALPRFLDDLMRETGWSVQSLQGIAVAAGPGSFTGLRIGFAAAKGIALAVGCPLLSPDTLEAIALAALFHRPVTTTVEAEQTPGRGHAPELFVSILDARKGRLYAALFEHRRGSSSPSSRSGAPTVHRLTENLDVEPEALAETIRSELGKGMGTRGWCAAGPGDVEFLRQYTGDAASGMVAASFVPVVRGVALLGMKGLLAGNRDHPRQGPNYIRQADVGAPRAYPRFREE